MQDVTVHWNPKDAAEVQLPSAAHAPLHWEVCYPTLLPQAACYGGQSTAMENALAWFALEGPGSEGPALLGDQTDDTVIVVEARLPQAGLRCHAVPCMQAEHTSDRACMRGRQ